MMTYCLNKKSPISHKKSRLLQLLGKVLPCVTLPVVLKWSTTQGGSAGTPGPWTQLQLLVSPTWGGVLIPVGETGLRTNLL